MNWKNKKKESGELFDGVKHFVLPPRLTGCRANLVVLSGRWFPAGSHKVGATYGCLSSRPVTGQLDPQRTKVVWLSTGNYCRGEAYISVLLACRTSAILPEGMSNERFDWLQKISGEVIATPGCESNVKEIFDKCWGLRNYDQELQIFNQFDELGNLIWHFAVTGSVAEELLEQYLTDGKRFVGYVSSPGSGGTLGVGYYLKLKYPKAKLWWRNSDIRLQKKQITY